MFESEPRDSEPLDLGISTCTLVTQGKDRPWLREREMDLDSGLDGFVGPESA
jgi:hypothetical protein